MSFDQPVFIHTLGRFQILVGSQPLFFEHRAPQRTLQLLTALIVAQGGHGASVGFLADLLWPEADGFDAYRALTTTLHRLRRLLRNPRAVRVSAGIVCLDPTICGVDLWILERRLRSATEPEELLSALELYHGPFLGDDPCPWAVGTRQRIGRLVMQARTMLDATQPPPGHWQFALRRLAVAE
jgi:DNA-binding SARP family transcriptional activator